MFETLEGGMDRRDVADEWDLPASVVIDGRHGRGKALTIEVVPPGRRVRPGPSLLEKFLELSAADDEAIVDYARRWGALTTCQHRDTWEIHRIPWPAGVRAGAGPVPVHRQRHKEPLHQWRAASARAGSILSIARALGDGQRGSAEDWTIVEDPGTAWLLTRYEWPSGDDEDWIVDPGPDDPLHPPRRYLASAINRWLMDSHVTPRLEWTTNPSPEYRHRLGGLSAAIAFGLLQALTSSAGLYSCSNCGKSYFRRLDRRRPKPGQMNYCEDCSNPKGWARGQSRRRRAQTKKEGAES